MPAAAAAAAALEEYTLLVFTQQTALAVEQLKVNANLCGPSSWLGYLRKLQLFIFNRMLQLQKQFKINSLVKRSGYVDLGCRPRVSCLVPVTTAPPPSPSCPFSLLVLLHFRQVLLTLNIHLQH